MLRPFAPRMCARKLDVHSRTIYSPRIFMETFAFDSHLHFLSLRHISFASYVAFAQQHKLESYAALFSPDYIFKGLLQKANMLQNLLSVLESDIAHIAALLEDDLRGKFAGRDAHPAVLTESGLSAVYGGYDYLVLTPLIMDFEFPEIVPDVYYRRTVSHNLYEAAADTLEGIRRFRQSRPDSRLIIRPSMGINPQQRTGAELSALLETCFSPQSGWSPSAKKATEWWKKLAKAKPVADFRHIPANSFSGIKVYPPLSFDPWAHNGTQREKLQFFYGFCEKHGVPLVTHCDDQGFRLIPQEVSARFTGPARWEKVLERFPNLYLNFAHFGKQYSKGILSKQRTAWRDKILELLVRYPNAYADLSFIGVAPEAWKEYAALLETLPRNEAEIAGNKLLFGTDWPLSLWLTESALSYWHGFAASGTGEAFRHRLLSENPARFHFRASGGK